MRICGRPPDFNFFEDYRCWATRQIAMVTCGLLNHIQAHVHHSWYEPSKCDQKLQTVYAAARSRQQAQAHAGGSNGGNSGGGPSWSKKAGMAPRSGAHMSMMCDVALGPAELSTDEIANKLVQAGRKILHLLDYEMEFDDGFFEKALSEMSMIMYVITAEELGRLDDSFLPLNCMMYDFLLDSSMFSPRKSSINHDDDHAYEDEQERNEMEQMQEQGREEAMDELIANRADVVGALRYTWRPLKLSVHFYNKIDHFIHET